MLEKFKTCKNMFIIFIAGAGGNHLSNMLSMHSVFEPLTDSLSYHFDLDNFYKTLEFKHQSAMVHFGRLQNLQTSYIERSKERLLQSKKINLFCAHAEEYLSCRCLDEFQDRIICLFSQPRSNAAILSRITKGIWSKGTPVDPLQPNPLYTISGLSSASTINKNWKDVDPAHVFEINSDLYSHGDYRHLYTRIQNNLGIELPKVCETMHQKWVMNVSKTFRNT